MKLAHVFRTFALCLALNAGAANFTLPAERQADWRGNLGVFGGIPTFTNWCDITVGIPGTNLVADATGVTNAFDALAAAIALCPAGGIIGIGISNSTPTYLLLTNSGSSYILGSRSDIDIVGAGMFGPGATNSVGTRVSVKGDVTFQWTYSPSNYRTNSIVYSADPVAAKGQTNFFLYLSPTANLNDVTVGNYVIIDQLQDGDVNDPSNTNAVLNGFYNNANGNEGNWGISAGVGSGQGSYRTHMQLLRVMSKSGTNITVWPPVQDNYTNALSPRIWYWQYGMIYSRFGLRNLSLDCSAANAPEIIKVSRSFDWWLSNVEIYGWQRDAVYTLFAPHVTIQHCYFHHSRGLTSSLGYGLHMQFGSDYWLVENFLGTTTRTPIVQEGGVMSGFTWYLLTSFTNAVGDATLQKTPSTHANFPRRNIHEGGIGGRFGGDNTHGNSVQNVFFRCWMQGAGGPSSLCTNYNWGFTLNRCDKFYSVVNCVVQVPGASANYEALAGHATLDSRSSTVKLGFDLGYTSDGFRDYYYDGSGHEGLNYNFATWQHDTNIWGSTIAGGKLIRQGVFFYPDTTTRNETDYGAQTYDASWVYTTMPTWWTNWGTSASNWGGIGSDVGTKTNAIPAVDRLARIQVGDYGFTLNGGGGGGGGGGSGGGTNTGTVIGGGALLRGGVNLRVAP